MDWKQKYPAAGLIRGNRPTLRMRYRRWKMRRKLMRQELDRLMGRWGI